MRLQLFILGIILFSCSSPEKEMDEKKITNQFIGIWRSVERIYPFTGTLEIKNDGSYKFKYGACMAAVNLKNGYSIIEIRNPREIINPSK
jgi:hypothetical protein